MAQLQDYATFVAIMVNVLLAARANRLAVLDGVSNAIDEISRIEAEAVQARVLGIDFKTLIHPFQIDPVNYRSAPDATALAQARTIVRAIADPANAGKGVFRVDGQLAELLHRDRVRHLIARAEAIVSRATAPGIAVQS